MKTYIQKLALVSVLIISFSSIFVDRVAAQTFTNLHSFTGSDGANPYKGVILSGSTLYGAAEYGGASGAGTIFKLNTDGLGFTNLYHFSATSGPMNTNTDGANPAGRLVLFGNTLYGTATGGGSSGNGTVFAINTDGSGFTNLYSFSARVGPNGGTNGDGAYPLAGLILSENTLYGVADEGGTAGTGTIFKLTTNGTDFTTLYNFSGGGIINSDGAFPLAPLTLSGNTLFGTTGGGGSSAGGTVFRINTDGAGFTNLHSFTPDASDPNAGLVLSGDTLYGAAVTGASSGGSVFKLSTNGFGYTNLYVFSGGSDGAYPGATLSLSGNILYGSAALGGNSGNGVIFKIHVDGTGFSVVHQFSPTPSGTNTDGASSWASVVSSGNMLCGAAYSGGSSGNGTVFSIFIQPQLTIIPSAGNVILTWPTNYAGFTLQSATNLLSPVWTTNSPAPTVVNGENTVTNPISGTQQFFRLSQ